MTRITMHGARQMTLGEMIGAIERLPLTWIDHEGQVHPKDVLFDFSEAAPGHLMSWRGSYDELALTFNDPQRDAYYGYAIPTAESFLAMLRDALAPGRTFGGWKGGEYQMTTETPVWVAPWGQSSRTAVVGVREAEFNEIIIDTAWCEL